MHNIANSAPLHWACMKIFVHRNEKESESNTLCACFFFRSQLSTVDKWLENKTIKTGGKINRPIKVQLLSV